LLKDSGSFLDGLSIRLEKLGEDVGELLRSDSFKVDLFGILHNVFCFLE